MNYNLNISRNSYGTCGERCSLEPTIKFVVDRIFFIREKVNEIVFLSLLFAYHCMIPTRWTTSWGAYLELLLEKDIG